MSRKIDAPAEYETKEYKSSPVYVTKSIRQP
jgi:hypothetical protein